MRPEDINSIDSESGIIASLIHNPEFVFYSENLLPNHFTNKDNRCIYTAICNLVQQGIMTVDPYNIIEILNSSEATRQYAKEISVDKLQELVEMSDIIARNSVEEYKVLVKNVMDTAFRRDTYEKLKECQALCTDLSVSDVEQKIYAIIDDVMTEFSIANEIPPYKDLIDECWREIEERQAEGYSGIPFKFPTLNEFCTLEKGELIIFGGGAKEGKSIMLLNCAVDLLKKGKAVLYLDSELSTRMFTGRLIAHLSGIKYKDLTTGHYSDEEAKKITKCIEWLKTRQFTHIYIPVFDKKSIYTAIKKVYHTQGIDVLIVDFNWFTLNALNCWNTLRAILPQRTDEINRGAMVKNSIDWAISSQASNRGRFNDYEPQARTVVRIEDIVYSLTKVRAVPVTGNGLATRISLRRRYG